MLYQLGTLNTAALTAPGEYVQIVPPTTRFINGVPTNILGIVGVGSWGPVNSAYLVGSPQDQTNYLGNPVNRSYDLSTAIAVALQLGQANIRAVRVSDGTDTAATVNLLDTAPVTGATLTAFYTGTVGNSLQAYINAGTQANTYKLTISRPGFTSEAFDNISQGVSGGTVTPGTGYTSVPALSFSAPQAAGGVQATGQVSLKVLSANVTGGGASGASGYVTNDTVTLPNGVILTVTASAGAITSLAVTNAGNLTGGSVPTNPVAPSSTSGVGTGALINLVWCLGVLTVTNPGSGYTSATATLTGGGGSGGSITLNTSIWLNLVNAVNNGNSTVRGPSKLAVATLGTLTAITPNTTTTYTMSGGTDGVSGAGSSTLVGVDGNTRKGMYALRGTGIQTLNLVDHVDSTAWGTIATFGQQEGIFCGVQAAPGSSYSSTATLLNSAGADSPWLKVMTGDWVYWSDSVNGVQRLLSPATFWTALRASLAPYMSTLNKPVLNLIGTQRAVQNLPYSNAELGAAAVARLDFLANPSAGGNYFSFQTDRNASSDPTRNGENYTTMTNFIALTLAAAFGYCIGLPQTPDLRRQVQNSIQSFLLNLWKPGSGPSMIGDVNNPNNVPYSVQINAQNNPTSQVALGYMNAYVKVTYLSIVRYFVISLEGGQSVSVQVSATPNF
jgi:hypothetical protein